MEIMVLRSVMGFDAQAMAWKVRGGSAQTNKICESKLSPEMIKTMDTHMYSDHVKFVMSLNQLTRANKTILTLLFVIELFSSDRPCLKNKELVAKGQEKFSTWLQAYLESIYPVSEARQLYPKLLMKLLDVRSLGESSAQLASHLDITRLEPLLVEIFSLQKWHQMTCFVKEKELKKWYLLFWHQRPCTIWHHHALNVVFMFWSTRLWQLSYYCLGIRISLGMAGSGRNDRISPTGLYQLGVYVIVVEWMDMERKRNVCSISLLKFRLFLHASTWQLKRQLMIGFW